MIRAENLPEKNPQCDRWQVEEADVFFNDFNGLSILSFRFTRSNAFRTLSFFLYLPSLVSSSYHSGWPFSLSSTRSSFSPLRSCLSNFE